MTMEKNGAISSDTPDAGCCGGGCSRKQAAEFTQFPETAEAADNLDSDFLKRAVAEVQAASR